MRYPVAWYAIILHLTWAGLLLFSISPTKVTGINILYQLFPNKILLAGILILSSLMAFLAITRFRQIKTLIWLLPQQFLLLLAAIAVIQVIVNGHFADGVIRDRYFLAADKAGILLVAFFHTLSLLKAPKEES